MFMNCVRIFLDVRTWIHIAFDLLMKSLTGTLVQFCAVIIDEWFLIGAQIIVQIMYRAELLYIRYIFKWWQYVRFALPLPESYVSRAQTLLEKKRKSPNTQKLSRNYIYCRLGRRVSIVSFRRVDYFFLTSNLMVQNNRSTNLNEN